MRCFAANCPDAVNSAAYVRQGATGSASGADWSNAYTTLPDTLVRGCTYWIAAGSYAGHLFKDPDSGTSTITVKAPTIANHGTAIGWNNQYQGQAVFNTKDNSSVGDVFTFQSDYYVIDGSYRSTATGNPQSDWTSESSYGFKIDNSLKVACTSDIALGANGPTVPLPVHDIIVQYVDVNGSHENTDQGCREQGVSGLWGSHDYTFQYNYIHDTGATILLLRGAHANCTLSPSLACGAPAPGYGNGTNITFEYNYFKDNYSTDNSHAEGCSCSEGLQNLTIAYNYWQDIDGTGIIATATGADWNTGNGPNGPWNIYGNIILMSSCSAVSGGTGNNAKNPGIAGWLFIFDAAFTGNVYLLNNTIAGYTSLCGTGSGILLGDGSFLNPMQSVYVQNNIYWNTGGTQLKNGCPTSGGLPTCTAIFYDHQAYFEMNDGSSNNDTDPNKVVLSSNPFCGSSSLDFRLVKDISAGVTTHALLTANDYDMLGNARGADGTWNRGAFQNPVTACAPDSLLGSIAYWPFDEGLGTAAGDSSGNGYTASLVNGATWSLGKIGPFSVTGNGTNGLVSIPSIDLSGTNAVTVTMWFNHNYSTSGAGTLFENSNNYTLSTTGFGLFPDDSGCMGMALGVHGNAGFSINCYQQPSSGVWHHLAAIYDKSQPGNSQTALYIDGALQSPTQHYSTAQNTSNFGNNPSFLFSRGGTQGFLAGAVDDLRVYNSALSASQINQIYGLTGATLTSITVTPAIGSLAIGMTQQYAAIGIYSDNSTHDLTRLVTWSSSTPSVGTITSAGLATGVATGTTNITATLGSLSASSGLTVTPAVIVLVTVTPTNPSVPQGQTQQFTAIGTFSDGTKQNVTTSASWSSSSTGVATVSSTGLASGVFVGTTTIEAEMNGASGSGLLTVIPYSVLTYHNDIGRTGQNLGETTLTLANVNVNTFGKLFTISVDGKVDAEPLYVSNVDVPGKSTHNLLIVATEHDSVYAFDADTGLKLWQTSMLKTGETTSDIRGCNQVTPEIGVTATPVIDLNSGPNGTVYVVAMTKKGTGNYFHRLHALNLVTGLEQFGGPQDINASYPGTASGGSVVTFAPGQYKERAGLLLLNGAIYLGFASHCDTAPYSGWVMGYDEASLQQVSVLNFTPNGQEGSIWMSGAGLAADTTGNIYFLAANGTFDTTLTANGFPINGDYGNAFVKVSTTSGPLTVSDYFNMYNTVNESANDFDLGSGGVLLLPDVTDAQNNVRHLAVGAGKDGDIYVVDRDNMGKFNPVDNSNAYQDIQGVLSGYSQGAEFGMPAYFNNTIYYGAVTKDLMAFPITSAKLASSASSKTSSTFAFPGTTPSISANGNSNGIVWAVANASVAVLHAYDASNLSHELYNTNQAANSRDHFGAGNKFITPMIANGKVYVGTTTGIGVFGLLNQRSTTRRPAIWF